MIKKGKTRALACRRWAFLLTFLTLTSWIHMVIPQLLHDHLQQEYFASLSSLTALPDLHKFTEDGKASYGNGVWTINLNQFPTYSILIPLIGNGTEASADEIFHERGTLGLEKFIVRAPTGYGIIAVIQKMDLDLTYNEETISGDECKNYLKFYDGNLAESERLCYIPRSFSPSNNHLNSQRTFISSNGTILVSFSFGKTSDNVRYNYRTGQDKGLSAMSKGPYTLLVSFTAFKECSRLKPQVLGSYPPCSSSRRHCIHPKLFCNGVNNCEVEANSKSLDEQSCPKPHPSLRPTLLSNINPIISKREGPISAPFKKPFPADLNPLDYHEAMLQSSPDYEPVHSFHTGSGDYYNPAIDKIFEQPLHPASTILMIVVTVVCIMILGVIVRFCCRKCVGNPVPVPDLSSIGASPCHVGELNEGFSYNDTAVRFNNQCSRANYELDLPPAYDDLFPSVKEVSSRSSSIILDTNSSIDPLSSDDPSPDLETIVTKNNETLPV